MTPNKTHKYIQLILVILFVQFNSFSFSQCSNPIRKFLNNCVFAESKKLVNEFDFLFVNEIDSNTLNFYQNIIDFKRENINFDYKYKVFKYGNINFEGKLESKRIVIPNYNKVYIVKYQNTKKEFEYWYISLVGNKIAGVHLLFKGKRPISWV